MKGQLNSGKNSMFLKFLKSNVLRLMCKLEYNSNRLLCTSFDTSGFSLHVIIIYVNILNDPFCLWFFWQPVVQFIPNSLKLQFKMFLNQTDD